MKLAEEMKTLDVLKAEVGTRDQEGGREKGRSSTGGRMYSTM